MREREPRLHHRLHAETRRALALARDLTGRDLRLRRVSTLTGSSQGQLVHPATPDQPFEIQYLRGQEPVLDHLIAHEVGHLTRLYAVPEAERLVGVVTEETRLEAFDQLWDELGRFAAEGAPTQVVVRAFDDWLHEIGTMLANYPAHLRIERWIANQFPGLRPVQERALTQEVQRGYPLLTPRARLGTAPTVYRAKMAMNAAEALHAAELLERPALFGPYRRHGFEDVAGDLMRLVFTDADEGHRSDMRASGAWAEALGVVGWFRWEPYQDNLL